MEAHLWNPTYAFSTYGHSGGINQMDYANIIMCTENEINITDKKNIYDDIRCLLILCHHNSVMTDDTNSIGDLLLPDASASLRYDALIHIAQQNGCIEDDQLVDIKMDDLCDMITKNWHSFVMGKIKFVDIIAFLIKRQ